MLNKDLEQLITEITSYLNTNSSITLSSELLKKILIGLKENIKFLKGKIDELSSVNSEKETKLRTLVPDNVKTNIVHTIMLLEAIINKTKIDLSLRNGYVYAFTYPMLTLLIQDIDKLIYELMKSDTITINSTRNTTLPRNRRFTYKRTTSSV